MRITGRDNTYLLDRFNVWVNETPVFGIKGLSLWGRRLHFLDTTLTITLSQGRNRIETSLTNSNATESYRRPLYVPYTPAQPAVEKRYFIGIGINKFAHREYNLKWSVKDIRDQARALKKKYGANVVIDTLFDKQVTVANIQALRKRLEGTTVNDKVIMAYSGHGLLSKDYEYYLSTYSVDCSKPEENGLVYDELEKLLDQIPARKKLLRIDACHSGEVDKEELVKRQAAAPLLATTGVEVAGSRGAQDVGAGGGELGMQNSFTLMQTLFVNVGRSVGVTVISAAGGMQYALKKNDLKNGVFSYSILELMKLQPHATVSERKQYVNKRVVQLTSGMQVPTTRNETNAVDWRVW